MDKKKTKGDSCEVYFPYNKTEERDTSPPFGMPSVGLTCYASCILQVLSSTPSFVTLLAQNAPKKESFSDLLLAILKKKSEVKDKKEDITHLLVFMESIDGTFDKCSQNDCASFLHVLLDALGRDEQTQGDFDVFFVDMIDEIECSTCMCKEHADFQRVLCIQLTTNLSEETGNGFFKRTDPVEFSFDLKVVGSEDEKRVEADYNLYAAVYHSGDLEAGHYYSAVRRGSDWYICDNKFIWKCRDVKEVLKFEDAYMLFYEQN